MTKHTYPESGHELFELEGKWVLLDLMLRQSYKMCVDNKSTLKLMLYFGFVFKTQWSFLNQKIGGNHQGFLSPQKKNENIEHIGLIFETPNVFLYYSIEMIL